MYFSQYILFRGQSQQTVSSSEKNIINITPMRATLHQCAQHSSVCVVVRGLAREKPERHVTCLACQYFTNAQKMLWSVWVNVVYYLNNQYTIYKF